MKRHKNILDQISTCNPILVICRSCGYFECRSSSDFLTGTGLVQEHNESNKVMWFSIPFVSFKFLCPLNHFSPTVFSQSFISYFLLLTLNLGIKHKCLFLWYKVSQTMNLNTRIQDCSFLHKTEKLFKLMKIVKCSAWWNIVFC